MHRNLLTLPMEMGGLAQRDIDAQCKVIQCSIIAKLHKVIKQIKVQTDLMLWYLNEYRNAKQGISFFKTYIGNTNRAMISPTYRKFLEAQFDRTGNEIPKLKTLTEIYNEPIFFNTHSDHIHNQFDFLNKAPPVSAEDKFKIVKDLCNTTHTGFVTATQLRNFHTSR